MISPKNTPPGNRRRKVVTDALSAMPSPVLRKKLTD